MSRKIKVILKSKEHRVLVDKKPQTLSCYDEDKLLSVLLTIKIREQNYVNCYEQSDLKILEENNLVKTNGKRIYLTKTSKKILQYLISPEIYVNLSKYLSGDSCQRHIDFDNLCIYILHLLKYHNPYTLWYKIKKLLEGQIEFIEENYCTSSGLLFNILKKLFQILEFLDEVKLLPGNLQYHLVKMQEGLKNTEIPGNQCLIADDVKSKVTNTKSEIILDTSTYTLMVNGSTEVLPVGAFKLLEILIKNQGKLLRYKEIYSQIYNSEEQFCKYTLINQKAYLCKKLKKLGIDASIIQNIAFTGYRLNTKIYSFKIC